MSHPLSDVMTIPGRTLDSLTVLASTNDPFRLDTPANHKMGQWLATRVDELGITGTVHLRGLHYKLVGGPGYNGEQYRNDDATWNWLNKASKAARWLGYVQFDRIVDQRNDAPLIKLADNIAPDGRLWLGNLNVELPSADDLLPEAYISDYPVRQPFRLVIFGEKSSLQPILSSLATRFDADLYLASGEPSDTMIHSMAKTGARDERPVIVFTFTDCDPSGWQMPISIGRKLQGFKSLLFHDLRFRVHHVGLLPEHVRRFDLPSTPMKDTERRADAWVASHGVHQTEIDSMLARHPQALSSLGEQAMFPYFDFDLYSRCLSARREWLEEAQTRIDENIDENTKAEIVAAATERLEELQEQVAALSQEFTIDPGELDLPEVVVPESDIDLPSDVMPLIDSRWDFAEQCDRLKAAKEYR